jgi:hypothetical protein
MKFKEFLRRAFGGRLHSERLRLFRKFLIKYTLASFVDPELVAADLIGKLNRNGLQSPATYFTWIREIEVWRSNNRIQQRRDAAKSRWQKKPKNSLGAGQQIEK